MLYREIRETRSDPIRNDRPRQVTVPEIQDEVIFALRTGRFRTDEVTQLNQKQAKHSGVSSSVLNLPF
jgi:hypothetical protein